MAWQRISQMTTQMFQDELKLTPFLTINYKYVNFLTKVSSK